MKKTDGLLLEKLKSIPYQKLESIMFYTLIFWCLSPLAFSMLGYFGVETYTYHGIAVMIMYFVGCIGLIFGGIYLYKTIANDGKTWDKRLNSYKPLLAGLLLEVWCVFCVLFANEKRLAIYGYESMRDCLFTFIFFGGFFLLGFVLKNKHYIEILIKVFLTVAAAMVILICFSDNFILFGNLSSLSTLQEKEFTLYGELALLAFMVSTSNFYETSRTKSFLFAFLSLLLGFSIAMIEEPILVMILLLYLLALLIKSFISKKETIKMLALVGLVVLELFLIISNVSSFVDFKNQLSKTILENVSAWNDAIDYIESASVVGYGPQNSLVDAKNFILQIGVYLGTPGILLFIFLVFAILKQIDVKSVWVISTSFLLVAMFICGSRYYLIAYFFLALGFLFSTKYSENRVIE